MSRPSVSPVVWHPLPAPARARRTSSDVPLPPLRVYDVPGEGPEDVLVDPADGSIFTGLSDGRVLRLDPTSGAVRVIADTGGRPLGLEWLPDGRLLVCDARRGLLVVDVGSGEVDELVTKVEGRPLRFCNNAAVAADGTIWFSDSSTRFGIDHWKADLIEHSGTGGLFRRTPDGTVETVAAGLHFANGVALAGDPAAVYVAETGAHALSRVAPGTTDAKPEPVEPNLPGFPDNISTGSDGLVWVTVASPRNALLDRLGPLPPLLRKVVWALPEKLQPKPADQVWVLAFDPATGALVHDLQGAHPRFGMVTGVREHAGTVWLGSLTGTTIACFPLAS